MSNNYQNYSGASNQLESSRNQTMRTTKLPNIGEEPMFFQQTFATSPSKEDTVGSNSVQNYDNSNYIPGLAYSKQPIQQVALTPLKLGKRSITKPNSRPAGKSPYVINQVVVHTPIGADQKSARKKKVSVNVSRGNNFQGDSSMRNSENRQNLVQFVSDNTPVHTRPNAWLGLRYNPDGMNKTQINGFNDSPTKRNESTFYKTLQSVKSPNSPP